MNPAYEGMKELEAEKTKLKTLRAEPGLAIS
jgi:hypothetical protein